MYAWFMSVGSQSQLLSGPLICEKALEMNKQLNHNLHFKATINWSQWFKARHRIRKLDFQGEILSNGYRSH